MIVLTYANDCIIVGPSMIDISGFVELIKNGCEKFLLTDEGDKDKFLGIKISQQYEMISKTSHTFLIDRIIYFLIINTNNYGMHSNAKSTLVGKPLIQKYLSGKPSKEEWNY